MTQNPRAIVAQGQDAERVIESDAFKLAMKTLRESVIQQWRDCPVRDKEGQLLLLQLAKVTDKFEGILVGLIEQGKMAQNKINLDEARDESSPRRFFRKVTG